MIERAEDGLKSSGRPPNNPEAGDSSTDARLRFESGVETGRQALVNMLNEPLVPFGSLESILVPEFPGIYMVYEVGEPVYIGSAKNLRRRICYNLLPARHNHYLASQMIEQVFHSKALCVAHLKAHCSVRYLTTHSIEEAKWLESLFIGAIRPRYNGGSKAFHKDT